MKHDKGIRRLTYFTLFCLVLLTLFHHRQITGLIFTPPELYKKAGVSTPIFYRGPLPPAIDLSAKLPPAGNQNPQNSCVGWALGYACRSYYNAKQANMLLNRIEDPTAEGPVISPSFIYNLLNRGTNRGINIYQALHLLIDTGVCTYKTMPYSQYDWKKLPSAKAMEEAKNFRIDTFKRIDLDYAVANIKGELILGNPVISAVMFDQHYFDFGYNTTEKHYLWDTLIVPEDEMGHAIVIVGYDDSLQAFKFLNSFGAKWGSDGYGWISYKLAPSVIREAYIIKPKMQLLGPVHNGANCGNPDPDVILNQLRQSYSDEHFKRLAEKLPKMMKQPSSGVLIGSVTVPDAADTTPNKQLDFNGFTSIKSLTCTKYEVVIQFFLNHDGKKGAPIMSRDPNFKLANGQAAVDVSVARLQFDEEDFDQWHTTMPLSALDIPTDKKSGFDYGTVTTKIIAQPVLFVDDFPLITGDDFHFKVEY